MSPNIWMQCGAAASIGRLETVAHRVVEDQHRSATLKLVDSKQEHDLLEGLLEESKPPAPHQAEGYHYLLFTPFRYPPLKYGSRFGRRFERGIWYGAQHRETCLAEAAYYRFYFLEGTHADLTPISLRLNVFHVSVETERGVDLTAERFQEYQPQLAHPSDYSSTQQLGTEMRENKVAAFVSFSARDPKGGNNVGVLELGAFSSRDVPEKQQRIWSATVKKDAIIFRGSN